MEDLCQPPRVAIMGWSTINQEAWKNRCILSLLELQVWRQGLGRARTRSSPWPPCPASARPNLCHHMAAPVCLSSQGIFFFTPPFSVHICLCTSSPLLIRTSIISDWDPPYSSVTHLNLHLNFICKHPFSKKVTLTVSRARTSTYLFWGYNSAHKSTQIQKSENDRVQELIRLFTLGGKNQLWPTEFLGFFWYHIP